MRITDEHRKKLCQLLHHALTEIRMLTERRKTRRAADLPDAFHNLPKEVWPECQRQSSLFTLFCVKGSGTIARHDAGAGDASLRNRAPTASPARDLMDFRRV